MENFKLSNEILNKIKIIIDRNNSNNLNKYGLSQLKNFYSDGFISKGAASKIISFYKNFEKSEEYGEKKKLYDEIKILPFCENSLRQAKNVEKSRRKTLQHLGTRGSQKGRQVNRLKPTMADFRPPKIKTPKVYDLFEEVLREKGKITFLKAVIMPPFSYSIFNTILFF